jgi:hypothetical protein
MNIAQWSCGRRVTRLQRLRQKTAIRLVCKQSRGRWRLVLAIGHRDFKPKSPRWIGETI